MTGPPPAAPSGGSSGDPSDDPAGDSTGDPSDDDHPVRGRPVPPGYDLAGQWQLVSLDDLGPLRHVITGVVYDLLGAAPVDPAVDSAVDSAVEREQTFGPLERVLVVATELASNAIRHGRPPVQVRLWQPAPSPHNPHLPTGPVTPAARSGGPGPTGADADGSQPPPDVIVETIDHDVDHLPQHTLGHHDGGRGLSLAGRLSMDMSWHATAITKHVWARLRLSHLRTPP